MVDTLPRMTMEMDVAMQKCELLASAATLRIILSKDCFEASKVLKERDYLVLDCATP